MTSEQHQFTAQGRTFPVILVRKKVKNINLHVRSDGRLYLSAPARVPWAYIEDFLEKKTDFIIRAICEMEERKQKFPILTLSDGDTLYLAGQPYRLDVRLALPDPVLKQRVMRSRWGSCMPLKGIVTMNTYLAIMPEAIIDHVMLHELCHFLQPNHSRHFYDAMTIRMPDWKARRQAMAKYLPYCV
ncbi:M48 family metallopeptidase [Megasphaera sp.]|uniref:M48 family metallopeptidase n=1 Tax=Megasphaera sp. TaxID=2023260 RepID=UPI0040284598